MPQGKLSSGKMFKMFYEDFLFFLMVYVLGEVCVWFIITVYICKSLGLTIVAAT